VEAGAGVAAAAFPAAAPAIGIGLIAARGIVKLYEEVMENRPAGVTIEEWRQILKHPVHDPGVVDQLVNEARARKAAAQPT
jgi:hypothetical protein